MCQAGRSGRSGRACEIRQGSARPARRTSPPAAAPVRRCRWRERRHRMTCATRLPSVSSSSSSASVFGPTGGEIEFHFVAQGDQRGIGRGFLGVAAEPAGIHAGQRHRGGQPQAELRLQPGARRGNVADAIAGLVQAEPDACDLIGLQSVLLAQRACGLDRRVRHVAGGMVLEEVVADVEAARRRRQRPLRMEVGAVRAREALGAFHHSAALVKPRCARRAASSP